MNEVSRSIFVASLISYQRVYGVGSLRGQSHAHITSVQFIKGGGDLTESGEESIKYSKLGVRDVPLTKLAFALPVAFAPAAPSVAEGGWEEGWEESTEQ